MSSNFSRTETKFLLSISTGPTGKAAITTSFAAFETGPGKLLKITVDTSNDKFAHAAAAGDVAGLCGHLVSLIVLNKGPERTPLALLGNHVQTALLKMNAADASSDVPGINYYGFIVSLVPGA